MMAPARLAPTDDVHGVNLRNPLSSCARDDPGNVARWTAVDGQLLGRPANAGLTWTCPPMPSFTRMASDGTAV